MEIQMKNVHPTQSTQTTHRQKIYSISINLKFYYLKHPDRIQCLFDIICAEFLKYDDEMTAYLEICENDKDPLPLNYFFMTNTSVNNIWPKLDVTTKDDFDKELVNKIDEFITIIPVLNRFYEYL